MIAIHSYGRDPGMEIINRIWPSDNPFTHSRHDLLKEVKHELGSAGQDLINAYSDQRSLFRYDMHVQRCRKFHRRSAPQHCWRHGTRQSMWGRSGDDRLSGVNSDRRYIEATRDVLQQHGGLWFYDGSFVISRRRE